MDFKELMGLSKEEGAKFDELKVKEMRVRNQLRIEFPNLEDAEVKYAAKVILVLQMLDSVFPLQAALLMATMGYIKDKGYTVNHTVDAVTTILKSLH